jgi:hypothetical protein
LRRLPYVFGVLLALLDQSVMTASALACASCGSGGDDPLVLFPAETFKTMVGSSWTPFLDAAGPDGKPLVSLGPESRIISFFAAGVAFSNRGFLTFSQAFLRNQREKRAVYTAGDPALSGRYTILMPQLSQPVVPQVQLVGGIRPALARSAAESKDPALLDVGGSGHDEYRAGIDIWMGMLPYVKPGLAATVTESMARNISGATLKPGRLTRITASLTSTLLWPLESWLGPLPLKVTTGLTFDRRAPMVQDGDEVADSAQLSRGLFASGDISPGDSLKVTWSRQGAFGETKNSALASSLALSWSRVIH